MLNSHISQQHTLLFLSLSLSLSHALTYTHNHILRAQRKTQREIWKRSIPHGLLKGKCMQQHVSSNIIQLIKQGENIIESNLEAEKKMGLKEYKYSGSLHWLWVAHCDASKPDRIVYNQWRNSRAIWCTFSGWMLDFYFRCPVFFLFPVALQNNI